MRTAPLGLYSAVRVKLPSVQPDHGSTWVMIASPTEHLSLEMPRMESGGGGGSAGLAVHG